MMKAGVVYPQTELGGDTGAVKAFAQAAEDLGYDHIVIYDHVLGAEHAGREPRLSGPYKETDPFHEPLITYAYLAGVTKKLELVTGVIILPQRQTALFAKQAADVDLFSDGRLRLGVGVGWNWVEFDGLEMSRHFRRRGSRLRCLLLVRHERGLRGFGATHLRLLASGVIREARARRDEAADDHVFLQAAQVVLLAHDRRFRENPSGLLERRGRDERVGGQ